MHPDLEKLIRLQRAEAELRRVEAGLAEAPRELATLEAALAEERGRLDQARGALEACQQTRRRHEGQLQDLEQKRSKYKGQLMEVKTNKEYTAMLHEIEGVERDIRGLEDQILEEMERAEGLTAEIKKEETLFREAEVRHKEATRDLDGRKAELERDAEGLSRDRDAAAASLPDEVRERFQRVARLRGTGVAEAREGRCEECHVVLRPQMFVDVKRNDTLLQCPSCSRLLFFAGESDAASPAGP